MVRDKLKYTKCDDQLYISKDIDPISLIVEPHSITASPNCQSVYVTLEATRFSVVSNFRTNVAHGELHLWVVWVKSLNLIKLKGILK